MQTTIKSKGTYPCMTYVKLPQHYMLPTGCFPHSHVCPKIGPPHDATCASTVSSTGKCCSRSIVLGLELGWGSEAGVGLLSNPIPYGQQGSSILFTLMICWTLSSSITGPNPKLSLLSYMLDATHCITNPKQSSMRTSPKKVLYSLL